jgi:hypothetical protein
MSRPERIGIFMVGALVMNAGLPFWPALIMNVWLYFITRPDLTNHA